MKEDAVVDATQDVANDREDKDDHAKDYVKNEEDACPYDLKDPEYYNSAKQLEKDWKEWL